MKLQQWLDLTGMTQKELCSFVGTTQPTISRHIKHNRVLDPLTIIRIYFVTMGAVRPDDFYDLHTMPADIKALMRGPKAERLRQFHKKIVPGSKEVA